jgi:hypothetical protein
MLDRRIAVNRAALAISCATRYLGIAVLVAAAVPGQRTGLHVVSYLVASIVASIPYIRWRKDSHKTALAAAEAGGTG